MVKLGKPKNSFDKAVGEIEAYMKNPAVSYSSLKLNSYHTELDHVISRLMT